MREAVLPTIQLLTKAADNLSRLYCETGNPIYLEQYTSVTELICTIKECVKRVEAL